MKTSLLVLLGLATILNASVIYSSYRKDYFYPYNEYKEANLPDPVNGGRFHLVSTADANGTFDSMILNGKTVQFEDGKDPDSWYVDWLHVYPKTVKEGDPLWISFHTRDSSFNKEPSLALVELKTSSGASLLKGNFTYKLTSCNVTYITTNANYSQLLIHIHNDNKDTRTIKTVLVNAADRTNDITNKASLSVPAKASTLLTVPLSPALKPGSLVTVVLEFQGSDQPLGTGLRVAKAHFPIEAYPKSHECPFPTVKDDNYKFHRDHGFDTFFFGEHSAKPCGSSTSGSDIAGKLAPKYSFYCLIQTDISLNSVANSQNVLAKLLGDEVDTHLDDQLRSLMKITDSLWEEETEIATYIGGSRSRRNGIFAGLTDIQGMDMYVAACAPHIQQFLNPPPLRGSYDYLRLTRNNHMPLPTWLYSQLLDDGWDAQLDGHIISHRQPNPDEARIQAMSVIAGCGKGLMYFQSEIAENKYYPKTWEEISDFNHDIGAVREYLREGDCTDMVTSSDGDNADSHSITQAIRSPEALLVTVINLKNDGGINDLQCELGKDMHWSISDHTVDKIDITVPSDFGSVVDKFELRNGQISDIPSSMFTYNGSISLGEDYHGTPLVGGTATLSNVDLSSKKSTRLFVMANSPDVRKTIQNNLKKQQFDN